MICIQPLSIRDFLPFASFLNTRIDSNGKLLAPSKPVPQPKGSHQPHVFSCDPPASHRAAHAHNPHGDGHKRTWTLGSIDRVSCLAVSSNRPAPALIPSSPTQNSRLTSIPPTNSSYHLGSTWIHDTSHQAKGSSHIQTRTMHAGCDCLKHVPALNATSTSPMFCQISWTPG